MNTILKDFTMIPNRLLLDPKIDDRAKIIYLILKHFEDLSRSKTAKIGLRSMCRYSSVKNPNTCKKLVDILEIEGWLDFVKNINGRCNTYITHFNKKDGQNQICNTTVITDKTKPSHDLRPNNINKNTYINNKGEIHEHE